MGLYLDSKETEKIYEDWVSEDSVRWLRVERGHWEELAEVLTRAAADHAAEEIVKWMLTQSLDYDLALVRQLEQWLQEQKNVAS